MNVVSQYQMIEAYDAVDTNAIYEAEANRTRIYGMFVDYFKEYDFLVCPTTQVMPFPVETDYVRSINGKPMKDYLQWMSVCCVLSITRLPVISMPCGFNDAGLPVGVQIVGKPGADFELLQFAQAFEDASRFSPKFKEYRPDMSKV
jgi:amidase